jgi:uncharacterized membrane protein YhhN
MNDLWLGLCLSTAIADWVAVAKGETRLERIAKPLTLLFLLLWFLSRTPLHGGSLFFALGLFFSLLGDLALLFEGWFLPGLFAFLLAHLAYIFSINTPLAEVSPLWSVPIAIVLALSAARLLRRIAQGALERQSANLIVPIYVYGLTLTLMILSALMTLFRPDWSARASLSLSFGALFFYVSDLILAWNRFVRPLRNGRLWNMILYHLGQILLTIGAFFHWGGAG